MHGAPAITYNPLFIYGGVGLGKTHLMQAIGNKIIQDNPSAKILYVTSEKFINELVNSIKDANYKNELFRNKYRNIDVLPAINCISSIKRISIFLYLLRNSVMAV